MMKPSKQPTCGMKMWQQLRKSRLIVDECWFIELWAFFNLTSGLDMLIEELKFRSTKHFCFHPQKGVLEHRKPETMLIHNHNTLLQSLLNPRAWSLWLTLTVFLWLFPAVRMLCSSQTHWLLQSILLTQHKLADRQNPPRSLMVSG